MAMFFTISTPVLFIATMPPSIKPLTNLGAILAVVYFWLIWTFNPTTFETSAWFTAAELIGYSGPIFIIILLFYLAGTQKFFIGRFSGIFLIILGITIGLIGEQYLLAYPFLIFGATLVGYRTGKIAKYDLVRVIFPTIVGLCIGLFIYWAAPGQQARNNLLNLHILDLHISNALDIYIKSVKYGYRYLLETPLEGSLGLNFLITLHSLVVVFISILAWCDLRRKLFLRIFAAEGVGIFIFAVLSAYHACFMTLVVSDYFPGYAAIFPGLLLTALWFMLLFPVFNFYYQSYKKKYRRLCYVVFLASLLMILLLTVLNLRKNIETEKLVRANAELRKSVYSDILKLVENKKGQRYALVDCQIAHPKYSWSMEPPWGIEAYFRWRDLGQTKVYLKGNYDFPKDWSSGEDVTLSCIKN
jgi:hypothetical protein